MEVIQVTNYDVLADEFPGGRCYDLDDYKKHIGNSRFSVLIDMYHEAFNLSNSRGKGDECQKIVDRIVDVTCHKDVSIVVNKGRFLVKPTGDGDWQALDEENSRELVRQCLSTQIGVTEEEPLEADSTPEVALSNMAINSDKKRGRRTSLLRRSASESTMLEDKKKTYRALAGLANEPRVMPAFDPPSFRRMHSAATSTVSNLPHPGLLDRQQSVPIVTSNGKISTHTGMDVVLADCGQRLSSKENIIGNNRLQVMLRLQNGRYKDLTPAEQAKVARDLVRAVCQYWGGRILVEQGWLS
jgi:hypothetical protein